VFQTALHSSPPDSSSPILEAIALTRHFGGLAAVNQVSFSIYSQEIFGLIGPNGAGKTTLLNLMTGLIPPSSGDIRFQDRTLARLRPYRIAAKGIARTFQNVRLFRELTALENVTIACHIHMRASLWQGILGLPSAIVEERSSVRRSLELLDLAGLAGRAHEVAGNFAYGDQRRLEIARALALEPKLLLLDEPAAGMNPQEKHQMSEFIRQIRHRFDLTIVLIEHHVPLVMGLCDRIAVLDFGQLIALGDPATVRADPAVIEAYLGVDG
jgi:branched-chain amino acid transport system ATP-binding protein